jgi:hypothetical protein
MRRAVWAGQIRRLLRFLLCHMVPVMTVLTGLRVPFGKLAVSGWFGRGARQTPSSLGWIARLAQRMGVRNTLSGGFPESGEDGWIRDGGRVWDVWLAAVKSCLQRLRTADGVRNGCMIASCSVESYSSLLNPNSAAFLVFKRLAVHNAVYIAISDDCPVVPLLAHDERQLPAFEEEYGITLFCIFWR